jgi:hypothetical protein
MLITQEEIHFCLLLHSSTAVNGMSKNRSFSPTGIYTLLPSLIDDDDDCI